MKIIWAQDDDYKGGGIFLAGPTLRNNHTDCSECGGWGFHQYLEERRECIACHGQGSFPLVSWRLEAIQILGQLAYQGELYVPEPEGCGSFSSSGLDASRQILWERTALKAAGVIAFWVPRDLNILPGFTTNVEFGEWSGSGKCVLGFPPQAQKMGYLEYVAMEKGIPLCYSLTKTLLRAKERHHDKTDHPRP